MLFRSSLEFLASKVLHDVLDNLLPHLVRMLDGVGENFAILDALFAVELAVETNDFDLILFLGLLDGGVEIGRASCRERV